MTIWIVLGLMFLLAAGFVYVPKHRVLTATTVILCATLSFALYSVIGSPKLISSQGELLHMGDMAESLAARLQDEPDDLDGWIMLGRSYMALGKFADATRVLHRAVEIEPEGNATALATLGEAMYLQNGEVWNDFIIDIFDKALNLDPEHTAALFWGGASAAAKGDLPLAIARWETLLAMNPGAETNQILQQGLSEWRGN